MKKIFLFLISAIFILPCLCFVACNYSMGQANIDNANYNINIDVEDRRGFDLSAQKEVEGSENFVITDGMDCYGYLEIEKENMDNAELSDDIILFKLYVNIFSDRIEIVVNNEVVDDYNFLTTDDGFYNYYEFEIKFNSNLYINILGYFEIMYL